MCWDGLQSRGYSAPLFVYDLDLLIDYLRGKPVDRDVHPITLLALNDKVRQPLRFREEIISYAGAGVLPACEKRIDFTA